MPDNQSTQKEQHPDEKDPEKKQEEDGESPFVIVDGKKEMRDGTGMIKESHIPEEVEEENEGQHRKR